MNVVSAILGTAVLAALVSGLVQWRLQRQQLAQGRALHLYDRRLEVYTSLIDSVGGVTVAIGTLGDMFNMARQVGEMPGDTYMSLHESLSAVRQTFGRAQYEALLIADEDVRRLVLEISQTIGEMSKTADETQIDEAAKERMTKQADRLIALRDNLLTGSRQELHNLLRLTGKRDHGRT